MAASCGSGLSNGVTGVAQQQVAATHFFKPVIVWRSNNGDSATAPSTIVAGSRVFAVATSLRFAGLK